MIFDTNTTSLNDYEVKIIEGYEEPADFAKAMYENALNDEKMFRAMLDIDAREVAIRRESANADADIAVLQESAWEGLKKKLADMWHSFCDKVSSIVRKFTVSMSALLMNGEKLVKKYDSKISQAMREHPEKFTKFDMKRKAPVVDADIDSHFNDMKVPATPSAAAEMYSETVGDIWKKFTGSESAKAFLSEMDKVAYKNVEVADTNKLYAEAKDYLVNGKKYLKTESNECEKEIREAKTFAKNCKADRNTAKAVDGKKSPEAEMYAHAYKVSSVLVSALLAKRRFCVNFIKNCYKFYKSIFIKCATIAGGKLEESYIDALAEATEDEVEDVITGAMKGDAQGVADLSLADSNLTDGSVSDDPDKLVYDDVDCYTAHDYDEGGSDGSIDTNINSRKESAIYSELLY